MELNYTFQLEMLIQVHVIFAFWFLFRFILVSLQIKDLIILKRTKAEIGP